MAIITFHDLSRLPIMREFYDLVWSLFRIRVVLRSPDGKTRIGMGDPPSRSPFCATLRRQARGERLCEKCDRKHVQSAMGLRRALRYHCHAGLTEFLIPIVLADEIIAFLVSGQILDSPPGAQAWMRTRRNLQASGIDTAPLAELFLKIHFLPLSVQHDLIAQLELFGNYVAYASDQMLLMRETRNSQIMARATAFIVENCVRRVCIGDVARAAFTSDRNLRRIFRAEKGMTVLECIQTARIAAARDQLAMTDKSCTVIAHESGFGSIQQFNLVFRKLTQMTPTEWRKRNAWKEVASQLPPVVPGALSASESPPGPPTCRQRPVSLLVVAEGSDRLTRRTTAPGRCAGPADRQSSKRRSPHVDHRVRGQHS